MDALDRSYVFPAAFLPSRLVLKEDASREEMSQDWRRPGRLLDAMAAEYVALIESLSYLGPLRIYPERHYIISGGDKDSVGVRGENVPETLYRYRERITDRVNLWFERFEIPYQLDVDPIGNEVSGDIVMLRLKDEKLGIQVSPSDVGFGIGQLLPIIVEGLVAEGRILCVEQPEIHLHPRLQAHLADLFIATSSSPRSDKPRSGGVQNQWIIETHSESLILRLQRRIRERVIQARDVSILYVEPGGESGSRVIPLELDERGDFITEWPDGFFEESFAEIFGDDLR
jgi:hypothetical protein